MEDGNEEKLILSFEIENCQKGFYYKIFVDIKDEEIKHFETEEILCEEGGENITFKEKMNCIFIFEAKQSICIITQKRKIYSNEEDIKRIKKDKYLASLVMSNGGIYKRQLNDDYDSEYLLIKLNKDEDEKEKRYLFDYLKNGTSLSCFISFDFSKTAKGKIIEFNKNILKHISQGMEIYTNGKFFNPSGFGAKINETQVSSLFDMSETNINPDSILIQYNKFLQSSIIPENKINISPLIKKLIKDIYNLFESEVYNVSFILLSQDIDEADTKKAIDNIIESSYLPLSIFAIGVGDNDFSLTKKIFENKKKHSSFGMEKFRNNVIFTKLNSHPSSREMILFLLRKLYSQIIEYYKLNKYNPENDKGKNKLMRSVSEIGSKIDLGPAPSSINSTELTPGSDSQNNIISNSDNMSNPNSKKYINYISNISNSNNSNGSYQLKTSNNSCPMYPVNPFPSTKSEKKESKNDNP